MQNQKENKMGTMRVSRLVLNMSLPIILSMLVQAMYNIVDSIYVSRVSEAALTAVSVSFPAQNLMIGLATGTGVGMNALLSRALGAGDRDRANRIAEHGLLLGLVGFVIFLIFGMFGSRAFIAAQTQVEEIVQYGDDYLTVVCCWSFGLFGQIMFERLLQATGRSIYSMYSQGLGALVNIILDPIFIFERGVGIGVFGMGVKGAAVATVIGQIVAFIFGIYLNHKKNPDIQLNLCKFKFDLRMVTRIYSIGIPSVIMVAIGSVMTFLMNKILVAYTIGKETAVAVFGVYFKLNSFVFMPVFGLNNGVIPIIAFNYGAKNRLRMVKAIKVAIAYAFAFMFVGTVLFMAIPGPLLSLFDASETMLAIGIPALRIIGVTFVIASVCIVLGSVFQALGHGWYSMFTSLARQMIVLVPAAFFLARYGMKIGNDSLVWWSYPIAEVASAIVTAILFIRIYRNVISKIPDGAPVK